MGTHRSLFTSNVDKTLKVSPCLLLSFVRISDPLSLQDMSLCTFLLPISGFHFVSLTRTYIFIWFSSSHLLISSFQHTPVVKTDSCQVVLPWTLHRWLLFLAYHCNDHAWYSPCLISRPAWELSPKWLCDSLLWSHVLCPLSGLYSLNRYDFALDPLYFHRR